MHWSSRWCCAARQAWQEPARCMMSPQLWQSTTSASRLGARAGAGVRRALRGPPTVPGLPAAGPCSHCSAVVASSTPGSVGCMRSPMVSTPSSARCAGSRYSTRAAEDVVDERTTRSGCRDRRSAAGSKRMLVNIARTPRAARRTASRGLRDRERVHDAARVEPCLATCKKSSPDGRLRTRDGHVTVQSATRTRKSWRCECAGSLADGFLHDHVLDDPLDDAGVLRACLLLRRSAGRPCSCRGRARRPSSQAHASRCSCSTSSTVTSSGMLTVLEIAPEMNACHGRHHQHMPHVVDRVVAHRAGEHGKVLWPAARCTMIVLCSSM